MLVGDPWAAAHENHLWHDPSTEAAAGAGSASPLAQVGGIWTGGSRHVAGATTCTKTSVLRERFCRKMRPHE